jgi:hypothetical protein
LQKYVGCISIGKQCFPYIHALYAPDLFGFVKDQLHGQRFETREAIQKAVRQSSDGWNGIFKLPERWKKCVQIIGNYVEK